MHSVARVALRRLRFLHRAMTLDDLRIPPGNRLGALKGERSGQYSIGVNDNIEFASAGIKATPTRSHSLTTIEEESI
jgi:plasmid maintenance system killer protein